MYCVSDVKWYAVGMTHDASKDSGEHIAPGAGLRIGDIAPDFSARSTTGDMRLSDCRGRWLVLFSHPADFTPVGEAEFSLIGRQELGNLDSLAGLPSQGFEEPPKKPTRKKAKKKKKPAAAPAGSFFGAVMREASHG